jgi:hypothetical protein
MKWYRISLVWSIGILAALMTSCENQDNEFPDFEYSSVYFSYQYPVRTIVLGEDIFDNTLDNAHKCQIYAKMGGVYANKERIDIDIAVDNALVNNLFFADGSAVQSMPSSYYSLAANAITLNKSFDGAVEVQLTDAFFADPNAIKNTYVIPLKMTDVVNADTILSGTPKVENPALSNAADWDVQPKNFVLYCVKFINPWHANYLRRGVDVVTQNDVSTINVRHKKYVENDEVCSISTRSLNAAVFTTSINHTDVNNNTQKLICDLILTFNSNGECTITSGTEGYTATGTGKYVVNGEKKSWGNKDRSALYLDYQIDYNVKKVAVKDTMVMRDRGVGLEIFAPVYNVN